MGYQKSFDTPSKTAPVDDGIPTFTPPPDDSIPTFTPPPDGKTPSKTAPVDDRIPTFTPPPDGKTPSKTAPVDDGIPTFMPPPDGDIPIFTPPGSKKIPKGATCYCHKSEPAVKTCSRCGKFICKECSDAFSATTGEYAGKNLCFNCWEDIVAAETTELSGNYKKIRRQFILSLVGIAIGAFVGISVSLGSGFLNVLIVAIIIACVGGVFLSAVKEFWAAFVEMLRGIFSGDDWAMIVAIIIAIVQFFVILIRCMVRTIRNTIKYIIYLRRTKNVIETNNQSLQQMREYMEYTIALERNKGADLKTMVGEGGVLANNGYAQAVESGGEQAAEATLHQAAFTIAENGEIVRAFPAAA